MPFISHLCPNGVSEMKEDSLDGTIGGVIGRGRGYDLDVPLEEQVYLSQELVDVEGGKELWKLTGYLP